MGATTTARHLKRLKRRAGKEQKVAAVRNKLLRNELVNCNSSHLYFHLHNSFPGLEKKETNETCARKLYVRFTRFGRKKGGNLSLKGQN